MYSNDISNSVIGIHAVGSRLMTAVFGIQKVIGRKYTPGRHEEADKFLEMLSWSDAGQDSAIKAVVGIGVHDLLKNYHTWAVDEIEAWVSKAKVST